MRDSFAAGAGHLDGSIGLKRLISTANDEVRSALSWEKQNQSNSQKVVSTPQKAYNACSCLEYYFSQKITRIFNIRTFKALNSWLPSSIWGTLSSKSQSNSSVMRLSSVLSLTAWASLLFWKVCMKRNNNIQISGTGWSGPTKVHHFKSSWPKLEAIRNKSLTKGVAHTCIKVFRTYLQDLEEAPVRLKSKVFATCKNKITYEDLCYNITRSEQNKENNKIIALFAKHETSLSASFTISSIVLPSGSAVACANSWHITFIPSTDCRKQGLHSIPPSFSNEVLEWCQCEKLQIIEASSVRSGY